MQNFYLSTASTRQKKYHRVGSPGLAGHPPPFSHKEMMFYHLNSGFSIAKFFRVPEGNK